MKEKLKKINELYKVIPEIILFILKLPLILLRKTDVKYKKKRKEIIHILGNGPSNLETLLKIRKENEKIICVNYFAITDKFREIKPYYYLLTDPYFFLRLKAEKNILFINALNGIQWNMTLFIPSKYKTIFKPLIKNEKIKIKFYRINYLPGTNKFVHYLNEKNIATPRFQNVIIACIYVALNLGFEKIKLHGVETSEFKNFKINKKNEALLEIDHFYGKEVINLFEEGEIKKGEFGKYLNYYSVTLLDYVLVEKYSKHVGVKVFNYTENSYIDAFEKK